MYVELVIPSEGRNRRECLDRCVARATQRWGACTLTRNQRGAWLRPDGVMCTEDVKTLGVDVGDAGIVVVRDWFNALCAAIIHEAEQPSVSWRAIPSQSHVVTTDTIVRPIVWEARNPTNGRQEGRNEL